MTKKLLAAVLIGGSFLAVHGQAVAVELNTISQKLSYTIGYEMGQNFKNQSVTIDSDLLIKGLQDGLLGQEALLDKKQREQTVADFQKEMLATQESQFKTAAEKNLSSGKAFLEENAKKPGVQTLSSGIQYKIIQAGTGQKPTLSDIVTVNYSGQLTDGRVFDSSYTRGKPATFPLNQVIQGWQEVLTLMPAGSTWEVVIPPQLAYGEHGMTPVIGPNETLVFKIQLLSIKHG